MSQRLMETRLRASRKKATVATLRAKTDKRDPMVCSGCGAQRCDSWSCAGAPQMRSSELQRDLAESKVRVALTSPKLVRPRVARGVALATPKLVRVALTTPKLVRVALTTPKLVQPRARGRREYMRFFKLKYAELKMQLPGLTPAELRGFVSEAWHNPE